MVVLKTSSRLHIVSALSNLVTAGGPADTMRLDLSGPLLESLNGKR
jgi:hypothetical protein